MSNLILELKAKIGADIEDICYEAAELASELKLNVVIEFNGMVLNVGQYSDYQDLIDEYYKIVKTKKAVL